MADHRITEEQVEGLAKILRTDASIDAKVNQVSAIKSGIKQHNVPDSCVAPLFEALRTASSSQHAVLVNAGFTALNHLLTRLSRQDPKYIVKEAKETLPLVVDKMGDHKEKFRQLAQQAMTTMYKAAPVDVERSVRNIAMVGKNPRAKEAGMQWVLQMHNENGLQFRSYVPTLMELLEDADGMVRDAAKATVIELFRNAPNAAKSDLKKQLKTYKVRPAIEQAIVKELVPTRSTTPGLGTEPEPEAMPEPVRAIRPNLAASMSSMSSERPITPMPEVRPDTVEPSYVNTSRELEDILREIGPWFEGRESEHNWLKREQSIHKLRRLIAGNVASDFSDQFLVALKALLDGIIKAILSLRTSLSKEGCSLVQDMAMTFGPGIDPMVELLMQTFIKVAAATKKIASQQANVCIDTMISRVTYNNRIMQHVAGAVQDKNVQPRLYAAVWLKTLLNKEKHHKNHVEHTGGLDLIEKSIKKGLNDPNPGVREKMRATYWTFAGIWPARAETLKDTLDAQAQKLLDKDPNNPNSPKPAAAAAGPARPGLGFSKSTMGAAKPSLRETMLAQKKAAMAAKGLPPRPGSAMSHFSPTRTASNSTTASASSTATTTMPTAAATRPKPGVGSGGGLSVAPVRPSRGKRPEMVPRPATAGPYSMRGGHDGTAEAASPPTMRPNAVTPGVSKTMGTSPKRTVPRVRPGHKTNASETSIPTPTRLTHAKSSPAGSPQYMRVSPASRLQPAPVITSSPSRAHEDFTLVAPNLAQLQQLPQREATPELMDYHDHGPNGNLPSPILTPSKSLRVYEDPHSEDQTTPWPTVAVPVLEEKPVNEDAASLVLRVDDEAAIGGISPEKLRQHSRLIDSAIAKIKAKSLDVHGFRKLQAIIRDNKASFVDEKFDALLLGLFDYIEDPQTGLAPEKVQDVKAQILATLRVLLKKHRKSFQPHISQGLEALLSARAAFDARTHIVSGLELFADELVTLGDAQEIAAVLTKRMSCMELDATGCRSISIGLHVLGKMVDVKEAFVPTDGELANFAQLCARCLESSDSGVRMDAVQLCVALQARVGDQRFWNALKGVKDDPKNLISYYIEKRRRDAAIAA